MVGAVLANDCCGMNDTSQMVIGVEGGAVRVPSHDAAPASARGARGPLAAILEPRSIAVIGATERPGSVGAAVMRNLKEGGFGGSLTPVNPKRREVLGLAAYPHVADVPGQPDLAVICTPARTVPGLVRECGMAGVGGLLILSAGFREIGGAGTELERAVQAELAKFPGMRAVGPNCLGLIVPSRNLNASFARRACVAGGVAILSQSGALCTAMLEWARDEGIGFSHFVSVGNMTDVGFAELLDYLADEPQTKSVVLYIEAVTDGRRFLAAAKRCAARKPVVAFKAGRHPAAAKAAASHTGAMAGEDAVYQAAFDEAGIVRVERLEDLLGTAQLLGRGRRLLGSRLAIVTNAGGPGVIATDALLQGGGRLATLSAETMTSLNSLLPDHWSHANPVDVIGDAGPERLAGALDLVLQDGGVDAALVIVTPQAMIDTAAAAWAVSAVAGRRSKPVLAAWMTGSEDQEALAALRLAGIAPYTTPEQAVDAFLYLSKHAQLPAVANELHRGEGAGGPIGAECRQVAVDRIAGGRFGTLDEERSKALLSAYGISVTRSVIARTAEEAVDASKDFGYPVVLKVVSPQVSHKTEVGGVVLDLRTAEAVIAAFDQIRESLRRARPEAAFEGVTVQPMIDRSQGVELIVGARRDLTFGPIVLVGAGGTSAEVLADRAVGLAPLSLDAARRLIDSLRIRPLLGEFRGRPALNIDAAADVVVRMSRLIADRSAVRDAEANPVLLTTSGATALDARVVLGSAHAVSATS